MAFKPEEFPIFTFPDSITIERLMAKFPQFLHNVAVVLQIEDVNEILVCQEILYEIFTRVEERRVYFYVYHNKLKQGSEQRSYHGFS